MTDTRQNTSVSILIAAVIILGIFALVAVGGGALFVYRHVDTQVTSNERAEGRFAAERQRFAGRRALIELRGDEPIVHQPIEDAPAVKLEALHALAYDTRARKLVHIDVPFWLLRLAPGRRFTFFSDAADFDSDRLHLTVDDLERHGPGLILDEHNRRGARILVWTE